NWVENGCPSADQLKSARDGGDFTVAPAQTEAADCIAKNHHPILGRISNSQVARKTRATLGNLPLRSNFIATPFIFLGARRPRRLPSWLRRIGDLASVRRRRACRNVPPHIIPW